MQAADVNGFFHFTAQGTGILTVLSLSSWYVIKLLRRIDRGFLVFEWQHGLMWRKYVTETDRIPPFPYLSHEDAAADQKPYRPRWEKRD